MKRHGHVVRTMIPGQLRPGMECVHATTGQLLTVYKFFGVNGVLMMYDEHGEEIRIRVDFDQPIWVRVTDED